jgi:aryl-alcohol dehydrogenase-like predicted oxidoreductase
MHYVKLGGSPLEVSSICLGTMTFGEQNSEQDAHAQLAAALEHGINFIDTAEMYPVMPRAETCGMSESIIGRWLKKIGCREGFVLATKVAGPSCGMPWIRQGAFDVRAADIVTACEASLRRLQTDYIDLYQLHWPNRKVPMFGQLYFDPRGEQQVAPIEEQLHALQQLVSQGKVRYIGVSNETPYGVGECIRLAEANGYPHIVTVQNAFNLLNRSVENGLDESLYRHGVSLLAYSPLAFGRLTMKYDTGPVLGHADSPRGRLEVFPHTWSPRYMRPAIAEACVRYNEIASRHGWSLTQLSLAYCFQNCKVASTVIGATTLDQLCEAIRIAEMPIDLSPDVLDEIDAVRWSIRDPAQ